MTESVCAYGRSVSKVDPLSSSGLHKETGFFDLGQITHGIQSLGLLISPAIKSVILRLKNTKLLTSTEGAPPLKVLK